MGLALPGSAQAGANVGRHIDEAAKKNAEAQLSTNLEYQKANAERKKQIYAETIREMTRLEMEKILTPMQRQVEKKLESVLAEAINKALPEGDKRIPEIKRIFLGEMRQYVNKKEEASALYGLYEATNGDNQGTSMETIVSGVMRADTAMTEIDVGNIFRRIAPQVTPNLNPTEIN